MSGQTLVKIDTKHDDVPIIIENDETFPFEPGERDRDWEPATEEQYARYRAYWDAQGMGAKVPDISIPEGEEFETWTNDVFTFRVISDPEHSYLVETRIANPRGTSLGYRQFDTLSDLYDDLEERDARLVK